MILPAYTSSIVAIRSAADVFLVRTPVIGGGPMDYTEFELFDQGAALGITHAWALRSIRAWVGGVMHQLMDQTAFAPGNVGTAEFAINVGLLNQPLASYSMYGFGHGHLSYTGLSIVVDDGQANYRDGVPVNTVLRGNSMVIDSTYVAKLADGSPVANLDIAHVFDASGLRVSQSHSVVAGGIGMQNSYSAMLPATNCNRVSANGGAPVVIGAGTGAQVGNWGAASSFALWHTARPGVQIEMSLPYGAPSDSAAGWADCTTSRTFLLDNPLNQKLYVNCRSGSSGQAFTGQHNYLSAYRVRKL